jgi:tripartite-type tricarboxylate transporter receptor subunit TctC
VPAIDEFVPGYEAISWVGIGAPANTPTEILAILKLANQPAFADPTFEARLADLGTEQFASSLRQISEYTEKWRR